MIRLRAAAKVNLALDVTGKRPDGYHEVDMIMQSVGIYDTLTFSAGDGLSLSVDGDAPHGGDNLVLRAARLLQTEVGSSKGAHITLKKAIPTAAGLGGGSTDSAATLVGLNILWDLGLSTNDLQALGARLGADIPFCVAGGTARATGIGTTLSPLPPPPALWFVIDKPCDGMLTRDVYGGLRLDAIGGHPDIGGMARAIRARDYDGLIRRTGNVLETVTLPARPAAQRAIDALTRAGADAARMTGSGPAVFAICRDEAHAREVRRRYGGGILCEAVDRGIFIDK